MQSDKEVFELIKKTYALNPNEEFVTATQNKLQSVARKMERKRFVKTKLFPTFGVLLVMALSLIIFVSQNGFSVNKLFSNELAHGVVNKHSASPTNSAKGQPIVYIYQTYNRESFKSYVSKDDFDSGAVYSDSHNMTTVGDHLAQSLNKIGVSTLHDKTDVMKELNEKRFIPIEKSYTISRTQFENALKNNKTIKMAFDIQRESIKKRLTTTKIKGKTYSRVAIYVSKNNKNYLVNLAFAMKLNNLLQKSYPSLSRGVFEKESGQNNLGYNQDLLPQSLVIEIGGNENTLQEEYRTTDVLAKVIKQLVEEEKN